MTKLDVINFYREQLRKFYKLGIGKKTENHVVVTDTLIEATKRRLHELMSHDLKASIFSAKKGSLNGYDRRA